MENNPFWAGYQGVSAAKRSHREAANQVRPSFGTKQPWSMLCFSVMVTGPLNCGWKDSWSWNCCRIVVLGLIFILSSLVYEASKANAVYGKSGDCWQEFHLGSCMLLQKKVGQKTVGQKTTVAESTGAWSYQVLTESQSNLDWRECLEVIFSNPLLEAGLN